MTALARLRTVMVEDEPLARLQLRDFIAAAPALELVGEAADGSEAVRMIDRLAPQLVLLDVSLPECSGLDVATRIRHRPEIVFVTAYDCHALAAFELGALDYLLKPFGRRRFDNMLERVQRRLAQSPARTQSRFPDLLVRPLKRLFARERDAIVPIDVHGIRHLRACGDYVEVVAATGRHLLRMPLTELVAALDPDQFRQVHRSHAVNLDAIERLLPFDSRRLLVRLSDGTEIIASRAASEALRALVR